MSETKAVLRYATEAYIMKMKWWAKKGHAGPAPTFDEALREAAWVYLKIPMDVEDNDAKHGD